MTGFDLTMVTLASLKLGVHGGLDLDEFACFMDSQHNKTATYL